VVAGLSLGDTVWVELLKAIFTGVFVAGAAALVVRYYQSRSDTSQRDRERSFQADEDARALKNDFVNRTATLAGSFYFATQRFKRQQRDASTWGKPDDADLDSQYIRWATACAGLETELAARYGSGSNAELDWHQVRDLLTVRYFDLRGKNSEGLKKLNAQTDERRHSGLTTAQLSDMDIVLDTFHEARRVLADELLSADLRAASARPTPAAPVSPPEPTPEPPAAVD
jgi:hypothetical protein